MNEVARVSHRQRPLGLDHLLQVEPLDILHRQHEAIAEPEGRIGGDDVHVVQLGRRLDLAEEPFAHSGPFDQVPADNLEHLQPSHELVLGKVHHPHPASTQLANDLVIGMFGQPRGQGVGRRRRGGNGVPPSVRESSPCNCPVADISRDPWAPCSRSRKLSDDSSATRR